MKGISIIFSLILIMNILSCRENSVKTSRQTEDEKIQQMNEDFIDLNKYAKKNKGEILNRLKSDNPKDRKLAIESIPILKIKESVPQLIDIAKNDPEKDLRASAIVTLAMIGGEEVAPIMLKALDNDDVSIRRSAAVKLAKLHKKEGIAELINILDSGNKDEEINAYSFLEELTGKDFGKITIKNKPGLIPYYIVDPDKKKEVFNRWKQWWREESKTFQFGDK